MYISRRVLRSYAGYIEVPPPHVPSLASGRPRTVLATLEIHGIVHPTAEFIYSVVPMQPIQPKTQWSLSSTRRAQKRNIGRSEVCGPRKNATDSMPRPSLLMTGQRNWTALHPGQYRSMSAVSYRTTHQGQISSLQKRLMTLCHISRTVR